MSENINGFKLEADAYRKLIERHPEDTDIVDAQRKIKLYDFLGECSDQDLFALFDSAAFNDIIKGYVEMCADTLQYSDEQKHKLCGRLARLLDDQGAEEAAKYYYDH